MTRDPRIDPRPGDIIDPGRSFYVSVTHVGDYVHFVSLLLEELTSDLTLDEWREYARNARVVYVAKEEG